MFLYRYYDYAIISNIELLNFIPILDVGELRVVFINYVKSSPSLFVTNSEFDYLLYDDVVFEYRIKQMTINIISEDSLCFQEVIRNRPFSVFCALDNRMVLHSSAVEINHKICAFCGKKGAGKTTIALALSRHFNLFTDDQLCLFPQNDRICAVSSDNIQKVTEETANLLNIIDNCSHFHPQYKKYIHYSKEYTGDPSKINTLEKIFFLKRNNTDSLEIKQINDYYHKLALILSHTISVDLTTNNVTDNNCQNMLMGIDMYYLYYGNGIQHLENIVDCIYQLMNKQM